MKKILLTLVAFMAMTAVNAEPVSRQQALKQARQFMPGKQFGEARSFARSDNSSDKDPFYVFNAAGNGGYVIVSGDDRTLPILGYSESGNLDMSQLPENLRCWLEGYARQIEALGSSLQPVQRVTTRAENSKAAIEPLIKTKWNQYEPYNLMCPDGNFVDYDEAGYDAANRCVTGCVATAMAQLMYFWQWPNGCEALDQIDIGTKVNKGTAEAPDWQLDVDHSFHALPATTFNWEAMKLAYNGSETDASATAVATLFRYCGQAVNMDYNTGGSQAGLIPYDMVKNFGYGKNAKQIHRFLFTSSEWEDIIYNELSNGRPVLYSGSSISGGHEFLVDGYDGDGLFHMNWGWGGMSDGFFVLSLANPHDLGAGGGTSQDGYSYNQDALIGLMPDDGAAEIPYVHSYVDNDETWVTEFTRSSDGEDFSEVRLPGVVIISYDFYDEDEAWPRYNIESAWGLYQDGKLKVVLGNSTRALDKEQNWAMNSPSVSFGMGMADGSYMLRQIWRPYGSEEWRLCDTWTYYMSYIIATIEGNSLTLRKATEERFTNSVAVNSVNFSGSSIEVGKSVEATVNLTNNGDTFQELICLWYGNKRTMVCGSIEPGKTGSVKLHFTPTQEGEMPLEISTDPEGNNVIWSGTVTVDAAKPQNLSATMTTPGLAGGTLEGTKLVVNVSITNNGSNIYENAIKFGLYQNQEDPESGFFQGPLITTKSVMTTIQPGKTIPVTFTLPDLNPEIQYFFFISYFSEGAETDFNEIIGYPFNPTDSNLKALLGDADGNNKREPKDIDAIVQYIMTGSTENFVFDNADINNDEKVDAADIVMLVNLLKE